MKNDGALPSSRQRPHAPAAARCAEVAARAAWRQRGGIQQWDGRIRQGFGSNSGPVGLAQSSDPNRRPQGVCCNPEESGARAAEDTRQCCGWHCAQTEARRLAVAGDRRRGRERGRADRATPAGPAEHPGWARAMRRCGHSRLQSVDTPIWIFYMKGSGVGCNDSAGLVLHFRGVLCEGAGDRHRPPRSCR